MSRGGIDELLEAIRSADVGEVERLLEAAPAQADARDENGISVLLLALYHGQPEVARVIRAGKRELDPFEAAALGDLAELRRHLMAGETAADRRSADGFTPLHLAAFFARSAAARMLLSAGADVDAPAANPSNVRPLHSAVAGRDVGLVRIVLAAGAEVDAKQAGGYTALHAAAKQGSLPMVTVLLSHGADPSVADDSGKTAADFARERGPGEILDRLERGLSAG